MLHQFVGPCDFCKWNALADLEPGPPRLQRIVHIPRRRHLGLCRKIVAPESLSRVSRDAATDERRRYSCADAIPSGTVARDGVPGRQRTAALKQGTQIAQRRFPPIPASRLSGMVGWRPRFPPKIPTPTWPAARYCFSVSTCGYLLSREATHAQPYSNITWLANRAGR
jgi:hypothetical protein